MTGPNPASKTPSTSLAMKRLGKLNAVAYEPSGYSDLIKNLHI